MGALLLILGVYLVVMGVGYCGYGNKAQDNVIVSISEDAPLIGKAAAVAIIVNLMVSTPIFLYCVFSAIQSTGDDRMRTALTAENIVLRIFIVLLCVLISYGLPFALEVIGLVSAIFGTMNNLFFPNIMYYMTRRKNASTAPPQSPSGRYIVHIGVLIVGILCLVFGVKGALATLLEKLQA